MSETMKQCDEGQAQQLAGQFGFSWDSIDWAKVREIVQFLFTLYSKEQQVFGAAGHEPDDAKGCICKALCSACCTVDELTAYLESHGGDHAHGGTPDVTGGQQPTP